MENPVMKIKVLEERNYEESVFDDVLQVGNRDYNENYESTEEELNEIEKYLELFGRLSLGD